LQHRHKDELQSAFDIEPIMDKPDQPAGSAAPKVVRRSWQAMGTAFQMHLAGADEEHLEAVAMAVEQEVRRLDALLSRHNPASETSRINNGAAAVALKVDADVWQLISDCERLRKLTDGFFDITAGSVSESPPADSIAAGAPRLLLDPDRRQVRFYSTDVSIDLGGIGKGFTLDRVKELLERYHVTAGLLSAGSSSILAIGHPPNAAVWAVDVRNPAHDTAPPVGRVELTDRSLSCSAAIRPGQVVSDIVDPHTQRPLSGGDAVVVLAPSGVEAEALSTALVAMGRRRAAEYLRRAQWTKVEGDESKGTAVAWIDISRKAPELEWVVRSDA
jgi:FAD:protein FMN transferase